MKAIETTDAPKAIGAYSQAIAHNDWVFTAGQIGIEPKTGVLAAGIEAQLHQTIKNLTAILAEAGLELSKVVKLTVFLVDFDHYPLLNEVMAQYWQPPFPARAAVEVTGLPKDALVEIEAIAAK